MAGCRLLLEPPRTRIRELLLLGRTRQDGTERTLPRHRHPDAWELCWFAQGSADWWAADGLHELSAGWCYLTPPGEEHGSLTGLLDACDLYWLQLAPPDDQRLARALVSAPRSFHAPDLKPLWNDLWAEVGREHALGELAVRGALHRLLAAALTIRVRPPSPSIARAMDRAASGSANVQVLARTTGLSRSVFHRRFLEEVGDSPASWLRRQRLGRAKRLLWKTDTSVTRIAYDCGWATSQRFATDFRLATGLAPMAWRSRSRDPEHGGGVKG